MSFVNILYSKRDEVARIMVNRPDKRNALNRAARLEILSALEDLTNDSSAKVVVISGQGGKSFIAGSDLAELSGYNALEMEEFMATLGQSLYSRLERLDKPVIAMIDGLCLGAGLEIALASDMRIASDKSKFGQVEILLGIIPGGGGTQRLSRLIGIGKTKELILTGNIIDASEAHRIGLVNQICPSDRLEDVVMTLAKQMAQRGPLALKWAKKSINISQEVSLSSGLAYEALAECLLFTTKDREEGMKAFLEKRKPEFTGQ